MIRVDFLTLSLGKLSRYLHFSNVKKIYDTLALVNLMICFASILSFRKVYALPVKRGLIYFCRASPILLALGISPEIAMNAIRLSVGRNTSKEDIDIVVDDLYEAVCALEKN